MGHSSTSQAYGFGEPVTNKIIESTDYTLDEKSGKYRPNFPPDPECTDYVHILINPLPQMANPAINLQ